MNTFMRPRNLDLLAAAQLVHVDCQFLDIGIRQLGAAKLGHLRFPGVRIRGVVYTMIDGVLDAGQLAKDAAAREELAGVLNGLLEAVRLAALFLTPIMPGKCREIRERLQSPVGEGELSLAQAGWGPLENRPASTLEKPAPLFPRIEAEADA